ncbi:hypothetical protein PMIN04_007653 [Paraphaeosphaeria minitans]
MAQSSLIRKAFFKLATRARPTWRIFTCLAHVAACVGISSSSFSWLNKLMLLPMPTVPASPTFGKGQEIQGQFKPAQTFEVPAFRYTTRLVCRFRRRGVAGPLFFTTSDTCNMTQCHTTTINHRMIAWLDYSTARHESRNQPMYAPPRM